MLPITGATRLAAVIGDPVRHSLSPTIHNAGFEALGLDWRYVALEVASGEGANAIRAMRALGIGGLSVTTPHKDDVVSAVDRTTASVDALGAANCIFRDGGRIVADNTDGDGFVASLRASLDVRFGGLHVAVVGAGGAARAIIDAVGRAGVERISVVNRTPERAAIAAAVHPSALVADPSAIRAADIVVNATTVGMGTAGVGFAKPGRTAESSDDLPFDPDLLNAEQLVADIVYQPHVTPLLFAAESTGCTTHGGVGMLLHQAAIAFTRWTGHDAPLEAMSEVLSTALTPPAHVDGKSSDGETWVR